MTKPETSKENKKITSFTGSYDFLSNTYPCSIEIDGLVFGSAESAFWSQRVKDLKARRKYTRLSPSKAREKALQAQPIDNWDELKDSIMQKILEIKFSNPDLAKKLKATKNAKLINTNTYRDEYWGVYMGKGKNILGILLTKVRDNL